MKKALFVLLTLILIVSVTACGKSEVTQSNDTKPAEQESVQPVKIVFGTGGTSGTYYPIGGALKPIFEASDLIDSVTIEATGASVKNIQNIRDGLNQIAIVMGDVAYDAIEGIGNFEGNKVNIQGLAGMYPNVVQVVATKESGIQSIKDFAGKRVSVGQVGSGVEQSAQKVLSAAGLTYDDMAVVDHNGYADSVEAMKNGNLDAAFFTSGVPNSNITDLKQTLDIVFIPIDGEVADTLLEAYPFYQLHTIPAGDEVQYDLPQEIKTVSIQNMIIVSPDLNDEVVYEMTKRFYDYLGTDGISIGALTQFDRNDMGNNLITPLHPGAKKFYEEMGLLK